jgi:hypothetical protein
MSDSDPIYCEGCGELIPLPANRTAEPKHGREPEGPAAGRASWVYCGFVIHQCTEGTYLPPSESAPPKDNAALHLRDSSP